MNLYTTLIFNFSFLKIGLEWIWIVISRHLNTYSNSISSQIINCSILIVANWVEAKSERKSWFWPNLFFGFFFFFFKWLDFCTGVCICVLGQRWSQWLKNSDLGLFPNLKISAFNMTIYPTSPKRFKFFTECVFKDWKLFWLFLCLFFYKGIPLP